MQRQQWVTLSLCLSGLVWIVTFTARLGSEPAVAFPARIPFTLTTLERTTGMISGFSSERSITLAIRADHSSSFGPGGPKPQDSIRRIMLMPALSGTSIHYRSQTKSTIHYPPPPAGFRMPDKAASKCGFPESRSWIFVAEEKLLGTTVFRYRRTISSGNEQVSEEDWYALDLGCVVMQSHAEWRNEYGKLTSVFDREPLSLIFGDPDPALFDVPPHYREVVPSEQNRAVAGVGPGNKDAPLWERRDAEYHRSKQFAKQGN